MGATNFTYTAKDNRTGATAFTFGVARQHYLLSPNARLLLRWEYQPPYDLVLTDTATMQPVEFTVPPEYGEPVAWDFTDDDRLVLGTDSGYILLY
jgi:hypothetical protein